MKRLLCWIAVVLTAATLCSCGKKEASANEPFFYTFTDAAGSEVTLQKQPEKVAVLFSSFADIWTLAGGRVDITVGESVKRGFAADDAVLVDPDAGHADIDLETLIAAQPDLVIGTADYEGQTTAVSACREAGIPAAVFRVETLDDYLAVLRIFCDITGDEDAYRKNGTEVKQRADAILQTVQKQAAQSPKILFVRAGSSERSTKAKTTDDNFVCAMLGELGAVNIADTDKTLAGSLSLEAIVNDNPDYLFVTTMGDETAAKEYMNKLLQSDGWKELSCVINERVAFLAKDLFHFKPNARWDTAYRQLAQILYPELEL